MRKGSGYCDIVCWMADVEGRQDGKRHWRLSEWCIMSLRCNDGLSEI